ncbi:MAG: cyclic nucleotide-binding domain-containing protein [Planctomycetota bacterium]|jgi:Fe-S-cluster-containing dehydrogenase component/CRP-like cAMP-binding protein
MSDALVLDRPKRWDVPFADEGAAADLSCQMTDTDLERLIAAKPFSDMDEGRFPRSMPLRGILQNDTRIRRYRKGDVVVRRGDYGNSAFLVLSGSVRVVLDDLDPALLGRQNTKPKSRWRSMAELFRLPHLPESRDTRLYPQLRADHETSSKRGAVIALQDVTNILRVLPNVLESENAVHMEAGMLFGELAALGRMPRTATVLAEDDAELLEIRWQGLRDLRRCDDALREYVDQRFRERGLDQALRTAAHLDHLDDAQLQRMIDTAEFSTYGTYDWYGSYQALRQEQSDPLAQEPLIAAEGHYPNGLVLIRAGFARLSRKRGNGEHTFGYLGKGDVYGLAELAHNAKHPDDPTPLTANLRAIGYVDVVRIPTAIVEQLVIPNLPADQIPELRKPTPEPATAPAAGEVRHNGAGIDPAMMEFLVENRFINGSASMLIDLDRCTRCDDCVRACSSGHSNNPRFIRHGATIDHYLVANACMHCADPVCMIGCPTGAIHRAEHAGEVVINDITCIGCKSCAESCPYDNIRMVEIRDRHNRDAIVVDPNRGKPIVKATKCDLCADHHGGPACERACPHDALKRIDMRDMEILRQWLNR